MNQWIKKIEDADETQEALSQALLDLGTARIREAMRYIEHAGHVELTELMASIVAMLASASQRKRDPRLRRKVVKRVRALCELLLEDDNIRETDPGDMARAVAAVERVFFQAGLSRLRVRLADCRAAQIEAENAEEWAESKREQERVRAEMDAAPDLDGVEQDLADGDDAGR